MHGAPEGDDRPRAEEEQKEEGKEERLGPTSSVEAVLQEAYGKHTQQLGHKTDGHQCVTQRDREEASTSAASLLYGEVLPAGVAHMLDSDHLCAATAAVLYDLGMGTGKLALQGACGRRGAALGREQGLSGIASEPALRRASARDRGPRRSPRPAPQLFCSFRR